MRLTARMRTRKRIVSALIAFVFVCAAFSGAFDAAGVSDVREAFALKANAEEPAGAVDLSTTVHLPPIGNQGAVGCCASMAITYMQFTNAFSRYMHSVDPDTEWDPSSGDPAYCFSPRFTYNLAGAGTAWVYEILKEQGTLPQTYAAFSGGVTGSALNNSQAKDWAADEGLWLLAQNYRIGNYDQIWLSNYAYGGYNAYNVTGSTAGQALIARIKSSLEKGNVVVTGGYPERWVTDVVKISEKGTYGKTGDKAIPYSTNVSSGGHQVAIIGYDDEITCRINGVTLKGAFKIANSWGRDWFNDGCIWMMYDAFNGAGKSAYEELNVPDRTWTMDQVIFLDWETDLKIGQPALAAEVTLTANDRDAFDVVLTRTDRSTGSIQTYKPYMFNYKSRRPNVSKSQLLTFNGKPSTNGSSAALAFNFDRLTGSIPAGKTIDDYKWGVRVNCDKSGGNVVVDEVKILENGAIRYISGDLNEEIPYGSSKSFVPFAESSGVWSGGGWTFADGVLTVFGKGPMDDYADDPSLCPFSGLRDRITKAVVDDGVTGVGSAAFKGMPELKRIVCGKDVSQLGSDAFSDDPSLCELVFKGPVLQIGQGTVFGSPGLQSVTVTGQTKDEFTELANRTENNENYEKAEFTERSLRPDAVFAEGSWSKGTWKLENGVLTVSGSGSMPGWSESSKTPWAAYLSEIRKVIVGSGITSVGSRAFSRCEELLEVVCGKDVSSLGMDAFSYTPLNKITFLHKITSIGQGTVYSCSNLRTVAVTDQTKAQFLTVAHRSSYNTSYDDAEFIAAEQEEPDPPQSRTTVRIYGSGLENWANSPNKGGYSAVTQILFCPSEWDPGHYKAGLPVTVNMRAADGSSNDTFTTTLSTVFDGKSWGVCRIEPCLMNESWIPVKDRLYKATFTFVDKDGFTVTLSPDDNYSLSADPVVPDPCDVDRSGRVSISDATYLLNLLSADSAEARDLDRDGQASVADVAVVLNRLEE